MRAPLSTSQARNDDGYKQRGERSRQDSGLHLTDLRGECACGSQEELTAQRELRKGGGELRMPLGQRVAHMAPERRRRNRDLLGELAVGTGDLRPKVEAGEIRAPSRPAALVGHVLDACGALVTGTGEHLVHALTRDA